VYDFPWGHSIFGQVYHTLFYLIFAVLWEYIKLDGFSKQIGVYVLCLWWGDYKINADYFINCIEGFMQMCLSGFKSLSSMEIGIGLVKGNLTHIIHDVTGNIDLQEGFRGQRSIVPAV